MLWLLWKNESQVHQWDQEPAVSAQNQRAQGDAIWGPDESPRRPHRSGVWETNYCCCRCAEGCTLWRGVSTLNMYLFIESSVTPALVPQIFTLFSEWDLASCLTAVALLHGSPKMSCVFTLEISQMWSWGCSWTSMSLHYLRWDTFIYCAWYDLTALTDLFMSLILLINWYRICGTDTIL